MLGTSQGMANKEEKFLILTYIIYNYNIFL